MHRNFKASGRLFALPLLLALFCVLCAAREARADGVVITQGSLIFRQGASAPFTLAGPGLSLTGTTFGSSVGRYSNQLLAFGTGYDGSGFVGTSNPDLSFAGQLVLGGVTYPALCCGQASGSWMNLGFSVPSFLAPNFDAPGFNVVAPFSANGFVNPDLDSLFPTNITGQGTVFFTFVRDFQPGYYRLEQVLFTFGAQVGEVSVTATPEPLTLLLFGTGLAGAGAAARRRRKT